MSEESREMIRALYELKTETALNTAEMKSQTMFLKEQFNNGFANIIVEKITKRTAIIMSLVVSIVGVLLWVI